MKMIIGIGLALLSTNLYSKPSATLLSDIACTNEVLSTISSIGTPLAWSKIKKGTVQASLEEGGKLELKTKEGTSSLYIETPSYKASVEFESPKCKLNVVDTSFDVVGFNDQELEKLLKENDKGAILLWSPHMTLSVYELVEMQDYLKSLKIPVKVVLDLNADKRFSKKILKKYNLPLDYLTLMNSRKLEEFGINVHYPSLVFYKKEKLIKRVPGYNSELKLKNMIKKYLDK